MCNDVFIGAKRGHRLIMAHKIGSTLLGGSRCQFRVWAPRVEKVEVRILDAENPAKIAEAASCNNEDAGRFMRLERTDRGYHEGIADRIQPGTRYLYRLDGAKDRPDPASRLQPEGVHGPSQVMDPGEFQWNDASWQGIPLEAYILYEIHVGTYTIEGTFDAIIPFLGEIKELGVTALELMPVAQFPGNRNWGYDGVYPFAVQNSYGGPEGLWRLVDACHQRGLAVVLDVVYNHLGPEGNYHSDFAPYFTDRYRSPWGQALNFDGPESDEVVGYFIANALYWLRDFHIDALRLDAIHGIVDCNAQPFLRLLAQAAKDFARQAGRKIYLVAESDLNDVRFILPAESGGYGLDAQWSDDFHHALHSLLTKEKSGYYLDFGSIQHLGKALEDGFVYSGQYSPHRRRRHGNSSRRIPARQFVVCAQNHDQVGNRMLGDRLSSLVSFAELKLAAGVVILSPYPPLLFMGEEWGEKAPFQYFTSHSDVALIEAVRRGRREEFAAFDWQGEPPDPQDEGTFLRCKLDHDRKHTEPHRTLWDLYRQLIVLRKSLPAFEQPSKDRMSVLTFEKQSVLQICRWRESDEALIVANFSDEPQMTLVSAYEGEWRRRLDTADRRWKGPGSSIPARFGSSGEAQVTLCPKSLALFERLR
ncbi:MAG TPA: malto-oligosyltrehalose trehalohydrolase [Terriglobia bacterium]|nr:malto-oligosyltrehalose trehalohydrolase [Terriglobia bacterium]